jgi:fucose permease
MIRRVKMFCGVFVLGGVTTADMPAAQTQAQMHPTVAHFQTLFAALGLWLYAFNLIEMGTILGPSCLPRNHIAA